MKKRIVEMLKLNKKKLLAVSIGTSILLSLGACGSTGDAVKAGTDTVKTEAAKEEETDYTDYIRYVKGLRDWTVEVGSTADFMENVSWDKDYIWEVTFDDSGVDLTKEGRYELTYRIKAVTEDGGDFIIGKKATVTVVSAEAAQEEVEKGSEVVTGNGIQNKQEAAVSVKDETIEVIAGKKEQAAGSNKKPAKPAGDTDNKKPDKTPDKKPSKPEEKPSKPSGGNSSKPDVDTSKPDSGTGKPGNSSGGSSDSQKPSGGNGTSKPDGGSASKPEEKPAKPSEPEKPVHKHTWVELVKEETIPHPEEGHMEKVTIKEAWDEKVPVYTMVVKTRCFGCHADLSNMSQSEVTKHLDKHLLEEGYRPGYGSFEEQVQTGTTTTHHDAVTEEKWVVDKEAWTETKKTVVGYQCSGCGAKK